MREATKSRLWAIAAITALILAMSLAGRIELCEELGKKEMFCSLDEQKSR